MNSGSDVFMCNYVNFLHLALIVSFKTQTDNYIIYNVVIIIIFIAYTHVTNKHTHEKNKKILKHTLTNNNYLQQTEFTSYYILSVYSSFSDMVGFPFITLPFQGY